MFFGFIYKSTCNFLLQIFVVEPQTSSQSVSNEQSSSSSKQPEPKGRFGRVLNFKQYYEKKTGTGRQFPSTKAKKGKGKGTEVEAKSRNQEVVIFIGIMKWSEAQAHAREASSTQSM